MYISNGVLSVWALVGPDLSSAPAKCLFSVARYPQFAQKLHFFWNPVDTDFAQQEIIGQESHCDATYRGVLRMIQFRGGLDMLPRTVAYQVSRWAELLHVQSTPLMVSQNIPKYVIHEAIQARTTYVQKSISGEWTTCVSIWGLQPLGRRAVYKWSSQSSAYSINESAKISIPE